MAFVVPDCEEREKKETVIETVKLDKLTSIAGICLAGFSLVLGFVVVLIPVESEVKIAFLTFAGAGKFTGAAIARYNPK
ncbi:MAG: hypothetical protein J7647_30870 [Cyanobacteria bacterium SBLK]|nr:hypothetical protein [Cyanobacteria bacterium SBLK]